MTLPERRGSSFQRVSGDGIVRSDDLQSSDLIIELEERPTPSQLSALEKDQRNGTACYGYEMPIRLVQQDVTTPESGNRAEQSSELSWGIEAVKADQSPYDGTGVTVAILDTGIDRHHTAFHTLQQKCIVERDFTNSSICDEHGHGTHCAGVICGGKVNGTRIGVAPGINHLVVGKILRDNSAFTCCATFIEALSWAILKENASIVSISCEIDFGEYIRKLEEEGFPRKQAISHGLNRYYTTRRFFEGFYGALQNAGPPNPFVVISAVGNGSGRDRDPPFVVDAGVPAISNGIISVGAVAQGRNGLIVAPFSNGNPQIVAPGVGIKSARLGGGLTKKDGTSFAVPHVAGIAALWLQKLNEQGRVSEPRLRNRLIASATYEGDESIDVGAGIIQAPLE